MCWIYNINKFWFSTNILKLKKSEYILWYVKVFVLKKKCSMYSLFFCYFLTTKLVKGLDFIKCTLLILQGCFKTILKLPVALCNGLVWDFSRAAKLSWKICLSKNKRRRRSCFHYLFLMDLFTPSDSLTATTYYSKLFYLSNIGTELYREWDGAKKKLPGQAKVLKMLTGKESSFPPPHPSPFRIKLWKYWPWSGGGKKCPARLIKFQFGPWLVFTA